MEDSVSAKSFSLYDQGTGALAEIGYNYWYAKGTYLWKHLKLLKFAIFFGLLQPGTGHLLSSVIFNFHQYQPTIIHIPVIIASIFYGPKVGAVLGGLIMYQRCHQYLSAATNQLSLALFVPNGSFSLCSYCHGASYSFHRYNFLFCI